MAMRNFGAAYESGYFPMIHCGTSYGHYKEVREQLVEHADLRDEVRRICDKLGKPFVMPENRRSYRGRPAPRLTSESIIVPPESDR